MNDEDLVFDESTIKILERISTTSEADLPGLVRGEFDSDDLKKFLRSHIANKEFLERVMRGLFEDTTDNYDVQTKSVELHSRYAHIDPASIMDYSSKPLYSLIQPGGHYYTKGASFSMNPVFKKGKFNVVFTFNFGSRAISRDDIMNLIQNISLRYGFKILNI